MNKYVIKLNPRSYRWMKKQTPEVQKVLGHFIATRWESWETVKQSVTDIQDLFIDLTDGGDIGPGCEALDKLFHYAPVGYVEG